jgi:glycine/D-amino acid oxidase-like deaminating enzyme/nitrite reductase/ring-hydroxylating ferredoxin subunit
MSAENPSVWVATAAPTSYPELDGDRDVDVAVVGGGVAGASLAAEIRGRGRSVLLLEANRVGMGVTGYSTVKLSSAQGPLATRIAQKAGRETALRYVSETQRAIDTIGRTIDRQDISCEFAWGDQLLFAETADERDELLAQFELFDAAGLEVRLVDEPDLPFAVAGSFSVGRQALFHPIRYVQGLVEGFVRDGGEVVEGTRALEVEEGEPCVVTTDRGVVRATDVVVATHYPIVDRGLLFSRLTATMEYAVAMEVGSVGIGVGMCYGIGATTRSVRRAGDHDELVVIVGEPHQVGHDTDEGEHWDRLAAWGRDRLGAGDVRYRWSTQDAITFDGLPMAGSIDPAADHLWVATGFNAWGMTNATIAAETVAEALTGGSAPCQELIDPNRADIARGLGRFLTTNASVAAHWVGDRLTARPQDVSELAAGEAAIIRNEEGAVAVHRDEQGSLHAVSAVCTHLGCIVAWNGAERSWDCPCHGSRFEPDGAVIEPPATEALDRKVLQD